MDEKERTTYLANVYYLLISDGEVDRLEERAFDEIRRESRAGYFDTMKAKEAAQKEDYKMELVGRLSDRIANLEDMLFAAYCNGVFKSAEKRIVKQFAQQLGISQAQMDRIKDETKRRYKEFHAKNA